MVLPGGTLPAQRPAGQQVDAALPCLHQSTRPDEGADASPPSANRAPSPSSAEATPSPPSRRPASPRRCPTSPPVSGPVSTLPYPTGCSALPRSCPSSLTSGLACAPKLFSPFLPPTPRAAMRAPEEGTTPIAQACSLSPRARPHLSSLHHARTCAPSPRLISDRCARRRRRLARAAGGPGSPRRRRPRRRLSAAGRSPQLRARGFAPYADTRAASLAGRVSARCK